MNEIVKCQTCNGTGIFDSYACPICKGNGELSWINFLIRDDEIEYPIWRRIERTVRNYEFEVIEIENFFRKLKRENKVYQILYVIDANFRSSFDRYCYRFYIYPNRSDDVKSIYIWLKTGDRNPRRLELKI